MKNSDTLAVPKDTVQMKSQIEIRDCYKFGTLICFVKPCIIRLLALLQETCLGTPII